MDPEKKKRKRKMPLKLPRINQNKDTILIYTCVGLYN